MRQVEQVGEIDTLHHAVIEFGVQRKVGQPKNKVCQRHEKERKAEMLVLLVMREPVSLNAYLVDYKVDYYEQRQEY